MEYENGLNMRVIFDTVLGVYCLTPCAKYNLRHVEEGKR